MGGEVEGEGDERRGGEEGQGSGRGGLSASPAWQWRSTLRPAWHGAPRTRDRPGRTGGSPGPLAEEVEWLWAQTEAAELGRRGHTWRVPPTGEGEGREEQGAAAASPGRRGGVGASIPCSQAGASYWRQRQGMVWEQGLGGVVRVEERESDDGRSASERRRNVFAAIQRAGRRLHTLEGQRGGGEVGEGADTGREEGEREGQRAERERQGERRGRRR